MLHISLNIYTHGWPILINQNNHIDNNGEKLAQKSFPCLTGPFKEGHDALICAFASNQLDWKSRIFLGNTIDHPDVPCGFSGLNL